MNILHSTDSSLLNSIHTVEEYIDIDMGNYFKEAALSTSHIGFTACKHNVYYCDDSGDWYLARDFYYNEFGVFYRDASGNITTTHTPHFIEQKYEELPHIWADRKLVYVVGINQQSSIYGFTSKDEVEDFMRSRDRYNQFIEEMTSQAHLNIEHLYHELSQREELQMAVQNLPGMIPDVFYTNTGMHGMYLYFVQWKSKIAGHYIDLQEGLRQNLQELIEQDDQLNQFVVESLQPFVMFEDILHDTYGVNKYYTTLLTHLLIRNALIGHYSDIWKDKYTPSIVTDSPEAYMTWCYKEGIVSLSDDESISNLAWFLLQTEDNMHRTIHTLIRQITDHLQNAEKEQVKESFVQRLFQPQEEDSPQTCHYSIDDIDLMTGSEFETFVSNLFFRMGFSTTTTPASHDYGIDVIAEKESMRIGIQAKCYSSTVGTSAIQEATAGLSFYQLNKAIVITNNVFTSGAIKLAQANNVVLWDRDILEAKIKQYF